MHPYLPHLLDDIKAAAFSPETDNTINNRLVELKQEDKYDDFEKEMEEIEHWVQQKPEHTLSYYCGLKSEEIPPAEQLNDKDRLIVCKALEEMLETWHFIIEIPDEIPSEMRFNLIVGLLNEKAVIINTGYVHFDFCTGSPKGCELGKHCKCRYFQKDELNIDDEPF